MIPLGDIDLQREIRLERYSGLVDRSHERARQSVRRVDLVPSHISLFGRWVSELPYFLGLELLGTPDMEATVIASLELEQYHEICDCHLTQYRNVSMSASATVNRNAVISCSSGKTLEDTVEIASLPNVGSWAQEFHWRLAKARNAEGDVMDDGWTRYYH
jgi:hypothetical protein